MHVYICVMYMYVYMSNIYVYLNVCVYSIHVYICVIYMYVYMSSNILVCLYVCILYPCVYLCKMYVCGGGATRAVRLHIYIYTLINTHLNVLWGGYDL